MKNLSLIIKTTILTALFTLLFNKINAINIDSLAYAKVDTTLILERPNASDSATVVEIVDGAIKVSTIFIKNPIAKTVVESPYFGASIVAFILAIWRRIELRRLRRKGVLIDKTFK